MEVKKVTRYYCDFCRKGGFRKSDMLKHELSCCLNPDRTCYTCKETRPFRKWIAFRRLACLDRTKPLQKEEVEKLSAWCEGCPTCLLAVFRLVNLFPEEPWNYRDERDKWDNRLTVPATVVV